MDWKGLGEKGKGGFRGTPKGGKGVVFLGGVGPDCVCGVPGHIFQDLRPAGQWPAVSIYIASRRISASN